MKDFNLGKDGRILSDFQMKPWMDRISKKRRYKNQAKGERNGNAKLFEPQVKAIRINSNGLTIRQLATHYGISMRHVYDIKAYKKWKHLS